MIKINIVEQRQNSVKVIAPHYLFFLFIYTDLLPCNCGSAWLNGWFRFCENFHSFLPLSLCIHDSTCHLIYKTHTHDIALSCFPLSEWQEHNMHHSDLNLMWINWGDSQKTSMWEQNREVVKDKDSGFLICQSDKGEQEALYTLRESSSFMIIFL